MCRWPYQCLADNFCGAMRSINVSFISEFIGLIGKTMIEVGFSMQLFLDCADTSKL